MKLLFLRLSFFLFLASSVNSQSQNLKSIVQFASLQKAKELLTSEDAFTKSWSQFDIDSRMKKVNSKKEDLLNYISSQALEWNEEEKEKINIVLDSINGYIIKYGFNIKFPNDIIFIKTTGQEEGGASGYTRANYIVLKEKVISNTHHHLRELIIHELFHILTRNDNAFKSKMYKIIGFEIMPVISYPESISKLKITNPDAPVTDSYITLLKDKEPVDCAMILYAKEDYNGGDFFKYLEVGFLKLNGVQQKEIDYVNGKPVIYSLKELAGFYEKVGRNTNYVILPEEVLADNFVIALENKKKQKSQWLTDRIQEKLRE